MREINQHRKQLFRATSFHISELSCNFALVTRATIPWGCVVWATRHIERRLLRLVLTVRNPEKISNVQVKNKAAVDAPWLYLYVQPSLCQGHWCIRTPMATLGTSGLLVYTYSVGLLLLFVSFVQAISQVPLTMKRATVQGFTLSFCLHSTYLYNTRLP